MKISLVLLLALLLTTSLSPSPMGADRCTFGVQATDYSCNSGGCESTTFTVPCTDCNYTLACGIQCTDGHEAHCKVTATLSKVIDGQTVAVCQNWDQEGCGGPGGSPPPPCLVEGIQYKLTVCFDACYTYTCTYCANCYAWSNVTHP